MVVHLQKLDFFCNFFCQFWRIFECCMVLLLLLYFHVHANELNQIFKKVKRLKWNLKILVLGSIPIWPYGCSITVPGVIWVIIFFLINFFQIKTILLSFNLESTILFRVKLLDTAFWHFLLHSASPFKKQISPSVFHLINCANILK